MKITIGRWILGCALGCAIIVVMAIPAAPDQGRVDNYRWWSAGHANESRVSQRTRAVAAHVRGLSAAYRSAQDEETARRVFGAARADSGAPAIWFAPDVPDRSRSEVTSFIAGERTARGEWSGHGPVGVIVLTDTATAIDRVKLPENYDRDRSRTTAVLPASRDAGDRCVTVIRLRHRALTKGMEFEKDRTPLDGCAFTDAFGKPGPQIAAWLRAERYAYARRLVLEIPAEERDAARYAWVDGTAEGRSCRAGDDRACLAETTAIESPMWEWWRSYWGIDRSVGLPLESNESFYRIDFETDKLLEALARDLGPARFQRVWQSPKTLGDAYFDQTGETFASWIRGRLVRFYGPYRLGPLPAPSANVLTIVLFLVVAAISIRLAARPSVA